MATPAAVPLEPYELDIPREAYCPTCGDWNALTVRVGVVNGTTLELLSTYESVTCPCGWNELTR